MYGGYQKCSKCNSKKLLICFGINDRGYVYKTCECCRVKIELIEQNILQIEKDIHILKNILII